MSNVSDHYNQLSRYVADISDACLSAGETCLPHTCDRRASSRIPGWSEKVEVEPLRQRSLFWHNLWIDCSRPKTGAADDRMRRTRANYHYAIRKVRKDEDNIL